MGALAADRNTPHKMISHYKSLKVKGSTTIYMGSIVSVGSDGYAIPATDTESTVVMGVAVDSVANAGADGAARVRVAAGVFSLAASSLTIANIGGDVTVVDDQTLGLAGATTNDIVAGKFVELDTEGAYWFEIGL